MNTVQMPRLRFSHFGLSVIDLPLMERFYTQTMGLTVTDRGGAFGFDVVFMSYDPGVHHQIVLGTGRPQNIPPNTVSPMFGPNINQISFELGSLADLRAMYNRLKLAGYHDEQMMLINHGTAWSVYFPDPEENKIELFFDTEWYIPQPFGLPLDFSKTDDEITAETEAMCRAHKDFQPMAEWRQKIQAKMTLES
jgi:catechol 2,3-dioxygenase-like lactoylglutathione lyase family enzyme